MPFIFEALMEKTWKRVGASAGRDILRMQKSHRKARNALTMFVYSSLMEHREEAAGAEIYVFHVVLEAFLHALPRPRRVSRKEIEASAQEAESIDVPDAPAEGEERTSEPHAMQYVIETLTESDDPTLTDEEIETFYRTLWVVVECLHRACSPR